MLLRLTSIRSSIVSSSRDSMLPELAMAALLTTMSMPPKAASVAS